ncbi:MAG TPA: hypothetical protein VGE37_02645, partial [Archangium sp.]
MFGGFMRWCFVFAVVIFSGCKKEAPPPPAPPAAVAVKPADPDAAFWAWAAAHVAQLKTVKSGREPVIEELSRELDKVQPGLAFELGAGKDPFELIISADGDKALFPVVTRLVAAAPALPGTKVIALRPRKDIGSFSMDLGGEKLDAKRLSFLAEPDEKAGLIALTVHIEGWTSERREAQEQAAFMLIEAALGEGDMETKIGAVEFQPASKTPNERMKPLTELAATVDGWKGGP